MQNPDLKIIENRFTELEAKIVQQEIRQSPDITGYSLRELLRQENVFKAYKNEEFVGACINFDFGRNWTELSGFVVLPKFRGQGIGKLLFKAAYGEAKKRGKNIYVVSRNPAMQKIMRGSNLTIITKFRQLSRVIRLHSLSFIISWYRLFEAIRKALFMKKSGKFVFGYKIL